MKRLTAAEINELFKAAREEVDQQRQEQEVEQGSKLTKLSKQIIDMGDKLRVAVADKYDAWRTKHKRRKFLKWCREKNILMVDVIGGNVGDYDALQRDMQNAIDQIGKDLDLAGLAAKSAALPVQEDGAPEREVRPDATPTPEIDVIPHTSNERLSPAKTEELLRIIKEELSTIQKDEAPAREM